MRLGLQSPEDISLQENWEDYRKPTTCIPWTDSVNCSPIEDLRSWQKLWAYNWGSWGSRIRFNTNTLRLLQQSAETQKLMEWNGDGGYIMRLSEISKYLWNEADVDIDDNIENYKVIIGISNNENISLSAIYGRSPFPLEAMVA